MHSGGTLIQIPDTILSRSPSQSLHAQVSAGTSAEQLSFQRVVVPFLRVISQHSFRHSARESPHDPSK